MNINKHTLPQNLVSLIMNQRDLKEGTLFFHLITTGHYWRNSYIKELQAAVLTSEQNWLFLSYSCESEEEEYDLLVQLSSLMDKTDALIGYNSTSFHIPYLLAKYKAYGMTDPIKNCRHMDLMIEGKKVAKFFQISQKLEDLRLLFPIEEGDPELYVILNSLSFLSLRSIFSGSFAVSSFSLEKEGIYLQLISEVYLGMSLHHNHPLFYLAADEQKIQMLLRTYENRIKVYYQNYKDYYYLPEEDMIVHKSMATGISKEKRRKATKENCYQYASLPTTLSCSYLEKYLKMLFQQIL